MIPVLCEAPRGLRAYPRALTSAGRYRTRSYFAALLVSSCLTSGLVYAATTWSIQINLERAATAVSNSATKRDRIELAHSARRPVQRTLTRHICVLPSGVAEITLRDTAGQVVYRSDPSAAETTVTRGTQLSASAASTGQEIASEAN